MPAPWVTPERTWRRFWAKVEFSDGCWEWTSAHNTEGYGEFWRNGRSEKAHRIAYEELVGPIPPGLQLDHLCRNRNCVNPAHLEAVDQRTNVLRGENACAWHARQDRCIRGHLFTEKNTRIRRRSTGRDCRECDRLRSERRRRESAAA